MKKIFSMIMVIAILALSAAAFAEGNAQESLPDGMPQQGQGGCPVMGGPNGGNRPNGKKPNNQAPAGERPDGAPELPSGEQPADAPDLPSGEKPTGLPERPSGRQPAGAPGLHGGEMPAGTQGFPGGEMPAMIDFDDMVSKGIISQDTCDKIKAYMAEHMPADMPEMNSQIPGGDTSGNPPDMNGQGPVMNGKAPATDGLLKDLLDAEVITQEEYDALLAVQTSAAV